MAATPILKEYRERRPDDEIIMTVITPGGHEVASTMAGKLVDRVVYAPFDTPSAVRRAVSAICPDLFVGLETELWPNLLHMVRQSGARMVLVNGRISDKSFPRYARLRPLMKRVLGNFDIILTQTETDAARFRALGAPTERVESFGNSKFDQAADRLTADEREKLRAELRIAPKSPVLIVGSTRVAEEEQAVLGAYQKLASKVEGLVLILAPRHIDRAEAVETAMREAGLNPVRRSRMAESEGPVQHLILDTFGELARVYGVADVAYIGNSLTAPGGGQNLLQPLAQAVQVVYGPFMQNFRDLCSLAEAEGVGFRVEDEESMAKVVGRLLDDTAGRKEMGERAVRLIQSNRGAAARYADAMAGLMTDKVGASHAL
jgi:3-deoxy-D-manno-octulosonic-acid transferase